MTMSSSDVNGMMTGGAPPMNNLSSTDVSILNMGGASQSPSVVNNITQSPVLSVQPSTQEDANVTKRTLYSPNTAHVDSMGYNLNMSNMNVGTTQSREIPAVYLPPIQYRYDTTTGKLIQLTGNEPNQLTGNIFSPNRVFAPNSGISYTTPRLGHSEPNSVSHLPTSLNYTTQAYNAVPMQSLQPQYNFPIHQEYKNTYLRPIGVGSNFTPVNHSTDANHAVNYETALRQYNERTNNFSNGLSKTFLNFENAATRIFRKPDEYSMSSLGNAALGMLHPTANYRKAAVFKLERLENIPINPAHFAKTAFNFIAYFDTNTENYDIHKSTPQCALLSGKSGFVDCELKGETIKIPWNGEEFVYLKLMQHVGVGKTVVGRLQLKVASLITDQLLRIPIIGDDGGNKGNAILEFSIGTVNLSEARQITDESARNAMYRQKYEQRSKCNRMPDYDAMIDDYNRFEGEFNKFNQPSYTSTGHQRTELQVPAAIDHFVRWCCDITDYDIY